MRWKTQVALVALLAVPALSGCLDAGPDAQDANGFDLLAGCPWAGEVTLYLGPDMALLWDLPDAGEVGGNGFEEAFLTNDMAEWTTQPVEGAFVVEGNLTLWFWSRGHDMAAPVVIGGDPGEAYHFFDQIGTSRGFVESYAVEYAPVRDEPTVRAWEQTFAMPEGGLLVEPGDHLRVLLTNLVLDEPGQGRGPDILYGGDTPSRITFQARCVAAPAWEEVHGEAHPVQVMAHQGLLTGAVPEQEGVNYALVPFELAPETDRLTITLTQTGGPKLAKDDMDLTVLDAGGQEVWSIGSPYTDEVGTKWRANLDATMPPGAYTVRVNSYSGVGYEGVVGVVQDRLSGESGSPPA